VDATFDYVVLGGGTAGSVVAARLAEDPFITVCLVEAGPSDEDVREILDVQRWPELIQSRLDWDYETENAARSQPEDPRKQGARARGVQLT
jgi:choline oxidase